MAKVIVSLSDKLLEVIDNYCVEFKYNRSEFVRYAVREILRRNNYDDTKKNKETD